MLENLGEAKELDLVNRPAGGGAEQMDVNKPIVTETRNLARWDKAKKARTERSFFTTEEPRFQPLLDALFKL